MKKELESKVVVDVGQEFQVDLLRMKEGILLLGRPMSNYIRANEMWAPFSMFYSPATNTFRLTNNENGDTARVSVPPGAVFRLVADLGRGEK